MIETPTPVVCKVDISLLNDPERLRERALAIEAWNANKPVDKFVDGEWIQIETQTAFFFDDRYRARLPEIVSSPVERFTKQDDSMEEFAGGEWVRYSDFALATKARDGVFSQIARSLGIDKDQLDWLCGDKCYYWQFQSQPAGDEFKKDDFPDIRTAIAEAIRKQEETSRRTGLPL